MRKYILIIATVFVIISSTIHAAELFISPSGNDSSGNGTEQSPYKTIQHALNNVAQSGDIITLRSGTYNEEVRIRMSNITIRSKSNEWAKISTTPTIDGDNATLTVLFDVGSDGSKLQRVEVTGGFYGIFFFSQWDWDDTPLDNDTATHIVIEDCKIHDTGRDAVKLPAGCDDITIRRCEIYNSGIGYPPGTPDDNKNAEGIDVVNSDRILVQDCYIHDTATTGVYIKGGSLDGIVERTKVENCGGLGISVGFDTSPEYFDLVANPEYYENIRGIVRNCIVLNTKYAGIALYGSKDAVIYNNTIVNTAKLAHSPIYFGLTYQDWDPNAKRPANVNPVIMNNVTMQTEAINSPCVYVRYSGDLGGMSALKGSAVMNNNCYYKTVGSCVFEDSRPDSLLENGTFSQWKIHISGESQSMETNPLTDAGYHLAFGSPCIDKGNNAIPGGISSTDKDNKPRIVNGIVDIGAYEFSGSDISVTPATQLVTKDAGSTTFSVSNTGTMPWTAAVTSGGGWLSITSGASGTDTGTITCSFMSNTGASARTATIRVTTIGAIDSPVDVTVTQTLTSAPTLLWAETTGRASIWTMDVAANKIGEMLYGPYAGWTPKSYHKNSDGTANMLWGRTDGYVSLWMMDASGNPTSMSYYGPYAGWTARSYHRNSDGTANMLWGRIDGYVSLWMMDASGNPSMSYYGPYEGWTATCYHGNSDGAANMLWVRTDGYVSLWTMDASGDPTSMSYYGPYEGWTAKSYYRNSDGTANMLWGRVDGYVSLWMMDASGNPTSMSYYGPYPGWTAQDYD